MRYKFFCRFPKSTNNFFSHIPIHEYTNGVGAMYNIALTSDNKKVHLSGN